MKDNALRFSAAWLFFAAFIIMTAIFSCSDPAAPEPSIPDYVDCSSFPDSRTSPYILPYAVGQQFEVTRSFEHYTPANGGVGLYAIDIRMPIGTPIHAMRSGVVIAVEKRFSDDDHADFHENWVMIRHADSTVARYIHLTQHGALVSVGDTVVQGEKIGLSGNSGASTGPHLHLDVQTCGPNLPPGYNRMPCGMTVPLSFRNTQQESCGLKPGRWYRAETFVPDAR